MIDTNKLKDIAIRALKTFAQAFLGAWAIAGYEPSKTALLAAASGAISAAWNLAITDLNK